MNTPNKLTIFRIILSPIFLLVLLLDFPFHNLTALVIFIIASYTDFLDGKIARDKNLITNFGKFLDPLADKMLTTAAFLAFLVLSYIDVWAVMLILSREFMVMSVRLLAAKDGVVVPASFSGKLKTVVQYISIIFMILAMEFSTWQYTIFKGMSLSNMIFQVPLYIGHGLVWVSVLFTLFSGFKYVWKLKHYFTDKD